MRPERLELEGFTAFRQRTVVDFTDADLFAFSGPTGAGKSSLIDAIVFVLYGTVPRLADRRRVAPVVSQGKVEARLGLDFSVGSEQYRAVRVVRMTPSGAASTKEARLERRQPDGSSELLAGDADELTRQIELLLGLSYDHFTTAVVLPQGEFARFLHHRPADRQALLKELLDLGLYDRLQQRANQHTALAAEQARFARARLDELADAGEEQLAALDAARDAVANLLAACDVAVPIQLESARRLETVAAEARAARQAAELLREVAKPPGVTELAAEHERRRAELAQLEHAAEPLQAELAAAEAALAAQPPAQDSERAIERHDELAKQEQLVAKGEAAALSARRQLLDAEAGAAAGAAAMQAAEDALQRARAAQAAAALAEHLHPGDDCPVCGQRIVTLTAAIPGSLAAATKAQKAAATAAAGAQAARQRAEGELARIEGRLDNERARLAELTATVAAGPSREQATEQLQRTRLAVAALAEQRAAQAALAKRVETARSALRRSGDAQNDAWAAFDRMRDRLARLEPPPAARHDLGVDWDNLASWAAAKELEVLRQLAATEDERDRIAAEREAALHALVSHATAVLGEGARLNDASAIRDRAVAAQARLAAERQRLEEDRRRAVAAEADLRAATEAEQVASLLTQLLRANRFGAWILDEAVQQLVEGATGLLQRLSGGAYSLVLDGKDFAVIDHNNADAVRSARTLSGGETFLASLALALALADQVVTLAGPTAAPLESLFLDEGFGTLDPDTLDTVATAIEELGSQGRMVGLVTHVRDLAERLPVRFEVSKGPDGATVERVLA